MLLRKRVLFFLVVIALLFLSGSTHELADDEEFDTSAVKPAETRSSQAAPSKHSTKAHAEEDEEFEDEHMIPPTPIVEEPDQEKASRAAEFVPEVPPKTPAEFIKKYAMEAMFVAMILVYLVNMIVGKQTNKKIATNWIRTHRSFFESQFEHVGMEDGLVVAEGADLYRFYATGRANCSHLLASIELKGRQDLLHAYIFDLVWPKRDLLTLDVTLDSLEPCVLGVFRMKDKKGTIAKYTDLRVFGKARNKPDLPQSLVMISDSAEAGEAFYTPVVSRALQQLEPYLQMIYISDVMPITSHTTAHLPNQAYSADMYPPYSTNKNTCKAIRVVARLPSNAAYMEEILKVTTLCMHLVDTMAKLALSDKTASSIREVRNKWDAEQAKESDEVRQEKLAQKRLEKKKQEDEAFEKMTPEQQRKFEEKKHKKELKQMKPKFKMMRV